MVVYPPGEDLFAAAAITLNEHGKIGATHLFKLMANRQHGSSATEDNLVRRHYMLIRSWTHIK
jgi:hypothetical protein